MSAELLAEAKKLVEKLFNLGNNSCPEADEIRDQLDEFYYTGKKALNSKELIELSEFSIALRKTINDNNKTNKIK